MKPLTFAIGVALLIAGALLHVAPDWDIPVSLLMAGLTYLFASWSMGVVVMRRWKMVPLALLASWFAIDGSYALYWHFQNPGVLDLMRGANFGASAVLYVTCGLLWLCLA